MGLCVLPKRHGVYLARTYPRRPLSSELQASRRGSCAEPHRAFRAVTVRILCLPECRDHDGRRASTFENAPRHRYPLHPQFREHVQYDLPRGCARCHLPLSRSTAEGHLRFALFLRGSPDDRGRFAREPAVAARCHGGDSHGCFPANRASRRSATRCTITGHRSRNPSGERVGSFHRRGVESPRIHLAQPAHQGKESSRAGRIGHVETHS